MIVAQFPSEERLMAALDRLEAAGVGPVETYTPAPLQGAREASPIPLVILLAALLGGGASFALQTWSYEAAYRFPIGGRPQFAWPSFIPTVFENAVLVAVAAGFAAFMLINGLPRLYDPVDEAQSMRHASSDAWVLAIRDADARARHLLAALSPDRIEELPG